MEFAAITTPDYFWRNNRPLLEKEGKFLEHHNF